MSSTLKLANNAIAVLAADISDSQTSISVTAGGGALFPSVTGGQWFPATLVDAEKNIEIVTVTARSSDTFTVVRAREGTTAKAFLAGSKIALRPTAGMLESELARIDADIALKAPLNSPGLTGTPTAPTATAGTNTTQIATTSFVRTAVTNLIDSSPTALDTLNELAAALGDDPNFATTMTTSLAGKVAKAGDTLTGQLKFAKGADIASASTVNLSTATGNTVTITGTTTITGWTMTSGQRMSLIFSGACQLTHHATNNSLPGGVNYTTAAGDRAEIYYDGTTKYVTINKASGKAIVESVTSVNGLTGAVTTGGMTLLTTLTTSSGTSQVANVSLTTYTKLEIWVRRVGFSTAASMLVNGRNVSENSDSSSNVLGGKMEVLLSDGTFVAAIAAQPSSPTEHDTVVRAGEIAITNATTQITFAANDGGAFDGGTIYIYGIR